MSIINPPVPQIVTKHMWVPENNTFIGAQPGSALVIHKTGGGDGTAEGTAHFFQTDTNKSAHFVVGQNGTVVQCVHLVDGAGANCCPDDTHNPWWNPLIAKYTNLNLCTISIEHCDPSTENSTPLTEAQKAASFRLIKWIVDQYGLDIHTEIRPHNSIDSTICPGNFPWAEMINYLQGGTPVVDHFPQEATDCWNSFFSQFQALAKALNIALPAGFAFTPPTGTGIYKAWADAWLKGHQFGPPLTFEYHSVRKDGSKIIVQEFAHARCEWDGSAHWFSTNGAIVV